MQFVVLSIYSETLDIEVKTSIKRIFVETQPPEKIYISKENQTHLKVVLRVTDQHEKGIAGKFP